jgi:hypothetical protein
MAILVIQPENHRRVPRHLDQQRMEAPQPAATEHGDLAENLFRMIQLRIACSEYTVPEQGHFFLEQAPGIDHTVQPIGLAAVDQHQAILVHVVTPDQVFIIEGRWGMLGVKQLLHRGLVPLGDIAFQLITCRPKTGATQEMGHESHILLRHTSPSFLW